MPAGDDGCALEQFSGAFSACLLVPRQCHSVRAAGDEEQTLWTVVDRTHRIGDRKGMTVSKQPYSNSKLHCGICRRDRVRIFVRLTRRHRIPQITQFIAEFKDTQH